MIDPALLAALLISAFLLSLLAYLYEAPDEW